MASKVSPANKKREHKLATAIPAAPKLSSILSRTLPKNSEKILSEPMSTLDLRKMLMMLQHIKLNAGKCARKVEIAMEMVEYVDVFF